MLGGIIMQHRSFKFFVYLYWLIITTYVYSAVPTENQAREYLKQWFSDQHLNEMCSIQTNTRGYTTWCSAFPTIQNSDLSREQKINAYINLIAIGIWQTDHTDSELNERIQYRLEGLKKFESALGICTYDDLETEFKSRSNPPTPETSDDDGSPKKRKRVE